MRSRPTEIDDPTNRLVTPSELLVWWISFGHVKLVSSSGGPAIREQISSLTNSLGSIMSFSGETMYRDFLTWRLGKEFLDSRHRNAIPAWDATVDYYGFDRLA